MNPGFQFEETIDGTLYRIFYKQHFVDRYELDEPDHRALKRTISEETISEKIKEALVKIDEDMGSLDEGTGVIVSESKKFIMAFGVMKTSKGVQVNMITSSARIDFTPRSAKDYIIKVNPTFNVRFTEPFSLAMKVSILADIHKNWEVLEAGTTYHLHGELMDYWIERDGDTFVVFEADWSRELFEIEVS
jgi:hypothetical protein